MIQRQLADYNTRFAKFRNIKGNPRNSYKLNHLLKNLKNKDTFQRSLFFQRELFKH